MYNIIFFKFKDIKLIENNIENNLYNYIIIFGDFFKNLQNSNNIEENINLYNKLLKYKKKNNKIIYIAGYNDLLIIYFLKINSFYEKIFQLNKNDIKFKNYYLMSEFVNNNEYIFDFFFIVENIIFSLYGINDFFYKNIKYKNLIELYNIINELKYSIKILDILTINNNIVFYTPYIIDLFNYNLKLNIKQIFFNNYKNINIINLKNNLISLSNDNYNLYKLKFL